VEIVHGLAEKERVIGAGQSDYAIGEVVTPKLEQKLEQKLEPGSTGASDGQTGERK
jgi:hypothetical protein